MFLFWFIGYGFVDATLNSFHLEENKAMSKSQKKNARRKQKKKESNKEKVMEFEVEEVIEGISGVTLTGDKMGEHEPDLIAQAPSDTTDTFSSRGVEEVAAPDGREKLKKVRNLRKKLKQIEELEKRILVGDIKKPDLDQLTKIAKKKEIQDELLDLTEGEEEQTA